MELVVIDGVGVQGANSCNFRKVSFRESSSARSSDNVIGRMLVGVGGATTLGNDQLVDGVDARSLVRWNGRTLSIDNLRWKVCRVDTAGEELGQVKMERVIVDHCTHVS